MISQELTAEQAKSMLPRYEQALAEERQTVNRLKRQISDMQNSSFKRKRAMYGIADIEDFQKRLKEWREPSLFSLEREVKELKLIASGHTWEQVLTQREKPPEDEPELTLF